MADNDSNNDLDKYLDNLGIDTDEGEAAAPELPDEAPLLQPFVAPLVIEGDAAERCESFLVHLLLNIDPGYAVETRYADEDEVAVDITGGDPGKIIGRGGRTLSALEYLTNAVVNRDETRDKMGSVRVNIDVGGYKERRDERLRGEARKAAARVRKTGFAVELDPMNAGERRVIHMALADDPSVRSESSGEGRDRRVVVKPVE